MIRLDGKILSRSSVPTAVPLEEVWPHMLPLVLEGAFSAQLHLISSRNAPMSEELRGTVPDVEIWEFRQPGT